MNEWMNHPAMKQIDPVKLELIKMAAAQTSGKHGNQMAATMMALITATRKHGITFSPEEISLIMEVLKDGKDEKERNEIDRMVSMVEHMIATQGKR